MGKNLYKFNTMKLRFKRRNKRSGQGEKRREKRGRSLIFLQVDIGMIVSEMTLNL